MPLHRTGLVNDQSDVERNPVFNEGTLECVKVNLQVGHVGLIVRQVSTFGVDSQLQGLDVASEQCGCSCQAQGEESACLCMDGLEWMFFHMGDMGYCYPESSAS
ncbi:MAG: hypothetical protein BWY82_02437 [Verrucomicrobia bacterium ADurb.Bin474]|nr:MAG: hypothetical protein BWY82_02437 [Verrucomicrobia bacterium ADurb.Bin474]